jgi:hypothetical protein
MLKKRTALWHKNSIMCNRMYGGRKKQKQLLFKGRNLTSKRFRGHKQGEHIVLMKKV